MKLEHVPAEECVSAELVHTHGAIWLLDGWLQLSSWPARAKLLDGFLAQVPVDIRDLQNQPFTKIITFLLEQTGEVEISCMEAAMAYRASSHKPWRLTAESWLATNRSEPVIEWSLRYPSFDLFVNSIAYDGP